MDKEKAILKTYAENLTDAEKFRYGTNISKLIENILEENDNLLKEHTIMKRIIIKNNLWEKLLNDNEFIDYLKE